MFGAGQYQYFVRRRRRLICRSKQLAIMFGGTMLKPSSGSNRTIRLTYRDHDDHGTCLERLTDLVFFRDGLDTIKAALAGFSASHGMSSIHIRFPIARDPSSLLHAAALLLPAELVFVPKEKDGFHTVYGWPLTGIVLPCYDRVTSIELGVGWLGISPPPAGEFPALDKLCLAGYIISLGTLLSRCPRLRVLGVTFRGVKDPDSLHAGLAALESAAAALGHTLSLVGIETRSIQAVDAARFGALLRTMARLSPQKVIFKHGFGRRIEADLPCFHHATSIEMKLFPVCFTTLLDGEFSALERLSLSANCSIVDLGTLVSRCPRLRVLEAAVAMGDIIVHSSSLQDLSIYSKTGCHRVSIDIVSPVLKQMELHVQAGSRDLNVFISAPLIEKFLWKRWYTKPALMPWRLECTRLESRQEEDTCLQLPRVHSLCLHISCNVSGHVDSRPNVTKEMEKLLISNFTLSLDLSLRTCGKIFGTLVFRTLRMYQIRATMEKLKISVTRGDKIQACPIECNCGKPKNWRSQSISLPDLEEMEIVGFNGEGHEHGFLRFISKCSPRLKRVVVTLTSTFLGCTTEIYNSFSANPSVKCYIYSSYGKLVQQASG